MYEIFTQPTKRAKVLVHIDGRQPTAIPVHISVGVGNKKAKYDAWLKESLNKNHKVLNYLAFIHEQGVKHGSIELAKKSKTLPFHAESIREFLIEHHETLATVLPYLKQGMSMEKTTMDKLSDEDKASLSSGGKMTLGDLPEDDRNQIMALMATNGDVPVHPQADFKDTIPTPSEPTPVDIPV